MDLVSSAVTSAAAAAAAAGAAAFAVGVAVGVTVGAAPSAARATQKCLLRVQQWRRGKAALPLVFDLRNVVRPSVLRVKSYAFPPRYEYPDPVLLDANENPYGPPFEDTSMRRLQPERYPDPRYKALREAFAGPVGVNAEQVFLGNGSDEVIDMLIRVFCSPGVDSIVVCPPTYAMYSIFAAFNDVSVVEVPLTADFQLRPDAVVAALTRRTTLVFLCSPGNPTGNCLERTAVEAVLQAANGAIVVVDEAYADFAGPDASSVPLLARYPNLVVMRTLSKAWGLAGARLGAAFASAELVHTMNVVRSPFNVSSLAEDAALRALAGASTTAHNVRKIVEERLRVDSELRKLAPTVSEVYPSDANFLLFRVPNAKEVARKIASECNVVVRYRGGMTLCEDCIRVTIGTPVENDQFLKALRAAIF